MSQNFDDKKEAKAKETQPATGSEQQNNNQATTVEDLPDQTDAIDARGLQPDFATRFSPEMLS